MTNPQPMDEAPDIPSAAVQNIVPQLRSLAVPINSLVIDPANARKHNAANIDAIKGSLSLFGQRKPVVVREEGRVVIAGNGTIQAARQMGWTHIAAIMVKDDTATATAFGIADNRTAELAEWDMAVLGTLLSGMESSPIDMRNLGFTDADISNLIEKLDPQPSDGGTGQVASTYVVIVECRDEAHQKEIYEKLNKEGESCRVSSI